MLCIDFCPRACITVSEQINSRGHHPAMFVEGSQCTGCRICATMCPDVCIEVFREGTAPTDTAQATTNE